MSDIGNEFNYTSQTRVVRRTSPTGRKCVAITMTIPVEVLETLYHEVAAASAFVYKPETPARGDSRIVRATFLGAIRQAINYVSGGFSESNNRPVVLDDSDNVVTRPVVITNVEERHGIHS